MCNWLRVWAWKQECLADRGFAQISWIGRYHYYFFWRVEFPCEQPWPHCTCEHKWIDRPGKIFCCCLFLRESCSRLDSFHPIDASSTSSSVNLEKGVLFLERGSLASEARATRRSCLIICAVRFRSCKKFQVPRCSKLIRAEMRLPSRVTTLTDVVLSIYRSWGTAGNLKLAKATVQSTKYKGKVLTRQYIE